MNKKRSVSPLAKKLTKKKKSHHLESQELTQTFKKIFFDNT